MLRVAVPSGLAFSTLIESNDSRLHIKKKPAVSETYQDDLKSGSISVAIFCSLISKPSKIKLNAREILSNFG